MNELGAEEWTGEKEVDSGGARGDGCGRAVRKALTQEGQELGLRVVFTSGLGVLKFFSGNFAVATPGAVG